jgi:hypothetical protein
MAEDELKQQNEKLLATGDALERRVEEFIGSKLE